MTQHVPVSRPNTSTNVVMSWDYLRSLLGALPSYTEVIVHTDFADGVEMRLMARDLPGPDRRFTNLYTGTEWFLGDEPWVGITQVEFPAFRVTPA